MGVIGAWGGRKFEVSPSVIRSFTGMQITGSAETSDKESSSEKYVSWQNVKPAELTLTVHLNAFLNCSVYGEAMAFVTDARWGKTDYFYIYTAAGARKLLLYPMMLTDAVVSNTELAPTGDWIRADVRLTLKQADKSDDNGGGGSSSGTSGTSGSGGGSSGGGGGSYSKASVRTTPAAATGFMQQTGSTVEAKLAQAAATVQAAKTQTTPRETGGDSTRAKISGATM